AELALGADLAGDASRLGGEAVELVDHRVDRVLQLEDLAPDVDGDLLRQVALRDRGGDLRDVADLRRQVAGHRVDRIGEVLPGADHAGDLGLAAKLALGAHLARDTGHLGGEVVELLDHRVDHFARPAELAPQRAPLDLERETLIQVAAGDSFEDAAHLEGRCRDLVEELVDRAEHHRPVAAELAWLGTLADPSGTADGALDPAQLANRALVRLDDV